MKDYEENGMLGVILQFTTSGNDLRFDRTQ